MPPNSSVAMGGPAAAGPAAAAEPKRAAPTNPAPKTGLRGAAQSKLAPGGAGAAPPPPPPAAGPEWWRSPYTWPKSINPASYLFLLFVDPLITRAYRAGVLEPADVLRLDEQKTDTIHAAFQAKWAAEALKEKPSISRALFSGHVGVFVGTGLLYAVTIAAQFAGPLLLQQIVGGLECRASGTGDFCYADWNIMYLYAALLFVSPFIRALCEHHLNYMLVRLGVVLRNQLMAAVYRKCLRLNNSALQAESVGRMVTLMSNDCTKVLDAIMTIHIAWGAPALIAVTMALLYGVLQWSMFVGLAAMLLFAPISARLVVGLTTARRLLVGFTDRRVSLMSEIIGGIRVIKLFAWEEPSMLRVDEIRNQEVAILRSIAWLSGFFGLILFSAPTFVGVAAFISYTLSGNTLTAATVYTALAYFTMLRFPLAFLPFFVTQLVNMQVSLARLQKFLLAGEIIDVDSPAAAGAGAPAKPAGPVGSVAIRGGCFSWDEDKEKKATLTDIDFDLKPGTLTMVVGPVGSGKSSVLGAIINHISRTAGEVSVVGSMAYVAQTAYVLNDTVKNNVLFGLPLDEARYRAAVQAAQLQPDLDVLPHGDQTEIGERGITMSGGQKQRVSIARALYARADVVVLDDPLSAVDSHVGAALFEQCISKALRGATRVLVTNALQYLPQADLILVMEAGRIRERGSYAELMAAGLDFASLMAEHRVEAEDEEAEGGGGAHAGNGSSGSAVSGSGILLGSLGSRVSVDAASPGALRKSADGRGMRPSMDKSGGPRPSTDGVRHSLQQRPRAPSVGSRKSLDQAPEKRLAAADRNLTGAEERSVGAVGWKYYYLYFMAAGGMVLLGFIIFLFEVEQGTRAATDAWLGVWARDGVSGWPVTNYLGVYVGLAVGNAFMICVRSLTFTLSTVRAAQRLHHRMLRNVLRLPSGFFDTTPSGRILNRFSKDTETIDSGIGPTLIQLMSSLATIFTTLVVISVATTWFAIALLPLLFLYATVQRYYVPTAREIQRVESLSRSPIYANFSETVTGVATIRAYGKAAHFTRINDTYIEDNAAAITTQRLASEWLGLRLDLLGMMIAFLCAILAVSGGISPGLAGLALVYSLDVTVFLKHATNMAADAESKMNSMERVEEYIKLPQEAPAILEPGVGPQLPPQWPHAGQIVMRDVRMRYRPDTPMILKGVSFSVQPGEKIGICGRTGSGKSSLMLALFRIVEVEAGAVELDGVNTSSVGLAALRSGMAMIPQDPFMFSGTVRLNIDPFAEYKDDAIWAALGRVGLKAVVEADEKKLEMAVTDNGGNFSQGQRQLFCMARALLRGKAILMMDEATASVDLDTDVLIQKTVREAFKHCTVLTIAHRLNTIMDSDKILCMDDGHVGEFDSPMNLLANPTGLFTALVNNTGKKNAAHLRSLAAAVSLGGSLDEASLLKLAAPLEEEDDDEGSGGIGIGAGAGAASGRRSRRPSTEMPSVVRVEALPVKLTGGPAVEPQAASAGSPAAPAPALAPAAMPAAAALEPELMARVSPVPSGWPSASASEQWIQVPPAAGSGGASGGADSVASVAADSTAGIAEGASEAPDGGGTRSAE